MNTRYFFLTLFLLSIEVLIALFINDTFVRPFLGDVLVVMLIFSAIRIFYSGKKRNLAIFVLLFSFFVEFSQYFRLIEIFGWEDIRFAQIILGSTFDVLDLFAYVIGAAIMYIIDGKILAPQRSSG